MDSDPLRAIADRLFLLVHGRLEWWREAVRRWASNPPHHVDEEGNDLGILPVPFPSAPLSADERIALLAAIHDTYAAGMVPIDPWQDLPHLVPPKADITTRNEFRMAGSYRVLGSRVPELRRHWNEEQAKVEVFLSEVEQQLALKVQDSSDLDALNRLSRAFTKVEVALGCISKDLASLQRDQERYELQFDDNGQFVGARFRDSGRPNEVDSQIQAADPTYDPLLLIGEGCKHFPSLVSGLWEGHAEAQQALHDLPQRLHNRLDALHGRPWADLVRNDCLDWVIAWPGETLHPSAIGANKVGSRPDRLLKAVEKHDPHPTWHEYRRLLQSYGANLQAIQHAVLSPSPRDSGQTGFDVPGIDAFLKPAVDFVPNKFQCDILKALDGRGLTKQQLADEVCGGEGTRLYRNGGIKELGEKGLVANKPRLGYYRPDRPPPPP